jgi:hypothetical protein
VSIGKLWPSAWAPTTSTRPDAVGASPASRKRRLGGSRDGTLDEGVEERLSEHVLGRPAEQQLSGLGPLGDRPLTVGEHEEAADDLPQNRVQRIVDSVGDDLVDGRIDARG